MRACEGCFDFIERKRYAGPTMFDTFTVKEKGGSTIEISGEIATSELLKHEDEALKSLGKDVSLPGFRKGKVPIAELKKKIPEQALWQEMAERTLADLYPKLLMEKKIKAIGRPHITVTKLAPNNPLGFTITTPVLPEITLPDYKALATQHPEPSNVAVSDEDVDNAVKEILARAQKAEEATKKQAGDENIIVPMPELNDEFVGKLGDYKDVAHFKESLRAELLTHKHRLEREKRRIDMLEAVMKDTKVAIPSILIEAELGKMFAQFKSDVERVGMKFEDYLKQVNKSPEDLGKEWRADAEKRAKSQLVLNKIAVEEKITADESAVEKEVAHVLSHHKDADKESVRIYVSTLLMNERVFEFLESQAGASKET